MAPIYKFKFDDVQVRFVDGGRALLRVRVDAIERDAAVVTVFSSFDPVRGNGGLG